MSEHEIEESVTDLLDSWSTGDQDAAEKLVAHLYADLRMISARLMANERPAHTLQPTALVNEVYLRLVRLKRIRCEDRERFLAFTSNLMRRILVEHARARGAAKRGGDMQRVDHPLSALAGPERNVTLLDLDDALTKLEQHDPFLVRLVELRYFAGMTEREAAKILEVPRARVQREWKVAKHWLVCELSGEDEVRRGT